jgi:hypothetical protein
MTDADIALRLLRALTEQMQVAVQDAQAHFDARIDLVEQHMDARLTRIEQLLAGGTDGGSV